MQTWLAYIWARVSGSLWFVPVLMSIAAVLLAVICVVLAEPIARSVQGYGYLYAGDVESARTLLSTVAGSMINVAGVSFSVTMVALSLASSQFGPHLLANFMRDRGNQIVLGGFIATFLFCLLSLGSTTSGAEEHASVSASVALLLAAFSLMLLIYFIHHIAASMQADHVIEQVAKDLTRSLERVFPEAPDDDGRAEIMPWPAEAEETFVGALRSGYLQAVDEAGLVRLATEGGLRLKMLHRPGHYVIEGQPLLAVAGVAEADEGLVRRIRRGFIVGGHRTAEQDPEFGVHQLVEIAARALSSGLNDPYTAITCVDHLTGALCRIGPRPVRPAVCLDADGQPRLELDTIDFAGVLDAAFNQIRQFSRDIPAVSLRVLEGLAAIATTVTEPARRAAIADQARMLMTGRQERYHGSDKAALEERFAALEQALRETAGAGAG